MDDLKSTFTSENIKAFIKELVETVVFVIVMLIIIRYFIGEVRWIPSASMQTTLLEGDRVFVERFSRFYKAPDRGDILVFYPPQENLKNDIGAVFSRLTGFFCKDIAYIKRVVGLPGETINIKRNDIGETFVYINGKKLTEPYVKDFKDENYTCNQATDFCEEVIVPQNSYFMMGDNRGNSQDSRYWGFLSKDRIIGRAVFIFWPLNRTNYFEKIKY